MSHSLYFLLFFSFLFISHWKTVATHTHTQAFPELCDSFWQSLSEQNNKACVCGPPRAAVYMWKELRQPKCTHPTRRVTGQRMLVRGAEGRGGWEVEYREQGRGPSERRERKAGFRPGDRELHEVTEPRCWLITITIICSKWLCGCRALHFTMYACFVLLSVHF